MPSCGCDNSCECGMLHPQPQHYPPPLLSKRLPGLVGVFNGLLAANVSRSLVKAATQVGSETGLADPAAFQLLCAMMQCYLLIVAVGKRPRNVLAAHAVPSHARPLVSRARALARANCRNITIGTAQLTIAASMASHTISHEGVSIVSLHNPPVQALHPLGACCDVLLQELGSGCRRS